jgi:general secretion pathway protein H
MTTTKRPGPWNDRAFTLLELIVVMVLIALTTSLAIPQIANFLYTDQLKASVRKLVGLLQSAFMMIDISFD